MPNIDPHTVILIGSFMSCLMALVLWMLRRSYPPAIGGLGEWSVSLILVSAGAALALTRDFFPPVLAISLARMLLGLGLYISYVGTQRFFGVTPNLRGWIGALLVVSALHVWFTVVTPWFQLRLIVSNLMGFALFGCYAYLVLQQRPLTFARGLTVAVLAVMSTVLITRMVTALLMPIGANIFSQTPEHLIYITSLAFCVLLLSISSILMASERLHAELQYLASHDSLTNALTRRHLEEACAEELERSRRHGHRMAILLMDLDHFKHINDNFGHQAGDQILVQFVARVGSLLRRPDQLARFGGEEFVALLPQTTLEQAQLVAQRIHELYPADAPAPSCTVSIGIATNESGTESVDSLLSRADAALYRAKNQGRNRTEVA